MIVFIPITQKWARLLGEHLAFLRTSAPFLSGGFAAMAGASGMNLWGAIFLIISLVLSREGWRWKFFAILVTLLIGSIREERLGRGVGPQRESRFVEGEIIVGPKLAIWSSERYGVLKEKEGKETRVAIQEGDFVRAGEVLKMSGKLFRPAAPRNPHEYSMLPLWEKNDLSWGVEIGNFKVIREEKSFLLWKYAEGMREKIRSSVVKGLPLEAQSSEVILAMMLGEKPSSGSEVMQAFRDSGVMHVFAVSGLHVGIVGGLVWGGAFLLRIPRRWACLPVIGAMVAYTMITGANPPAIRASIMAASLLGAFLFGRRPNVVNSLGFSLLVVLLWRPAQIGEIGFQLSYLVIASIALGYGWVFSWTGKLAKIDLFLPRRLLTRWQEWGVKIRAWVAGMLATSLVAWVGSLPLTAYHFGLVSPVAVLASVLLIPLTTVILGLGFLSSLVEALYTGASKPINEFNGKVAHLAYLSAEGFSEIPLGHFSTGSREPADWVVFDFADGGAASYLGGEVNALLDCGSERKFYQVLAPALRRWQVEPETIFLSHPDGKHSGAISLVEERFRPSELVVSGFWSRSPTYRKFIAEGDFCARGIAVAKQGQVIQLSNEAFAEILYEGKENTDIISDSRGMALRVTWKGWRILVMGDLGLQEEIEMLESGEDLAAEVIILGSHRRTYSGSTPFLKAVSPRVVIKSYARYPEYEMPRKKWLEACDELEIDVLQQGETGAVFIDFADEKMILRSFLKLGSPRVLER